MSIVSYVIMAVAAVGEISRQQSNSNRIPILFSFIVVRLSFYCLEEQEEKQKKRAKRADSERLNTFRVVQLK